MGEGKETAMDTEQREQVAEKIRATRKERGWSQARLAQEAGVSENTVLSIETGKRTPQEGKLRAILDALGLATPIDGSLDLEGVPEDVRIFFRVAAARFRAMTDADQRARALARMYPALIMDD